MARTAVLLCIMYVFDVHLFHQPYPILHGESGFYKLR